MQSGGPFGALPFFALGPEIRISRELHLLNWSGLRLDDPSLLQ